MKRSRNFVVLGVLQILVGAGAIPAGLSMLARPDGSGLGLPIHLLEASPFETFLIPGLVLLIVNGILQLGGAVASFRKHRKAGRLGMALGLLLICWILVQMAMIREAGLLHFIYLGIGTLQFRIGYLLHGKDAGTSEIPLG
jgi:hypothetical protein